MSTKRICPKDYQDIFNAFISYKDTSTTISEKLFSYIFIADCFNKYIIQNGYTKKASTNEITNTSSSSSPSSSILSDYVVSDVDNMEIPDNVNDCISQLKQTHNKLQSCNSNNNEIIRESNYATQNANMKQIIQSNEAQLSEYTQQIAQQDELIKSKSQEYRQLHAQYNKLYDAYNEYKRAYESAEVVNNQLNDNMRILNENADQLKSQLYNLNNENNTRITELNNTKSLLSQMEDELKQQTIDYENSLAWKDRSCDQTMIENEKMRTQNFEQQNQINELTNLNENLQKDILKISEQYKLLLKNSETLSRNNEQLYYEQERTTQSISQILADLEASDRIIDQRKDTTLVHKRRSIDNIQFGGISKLRFMNKPYELKAYLYNTVSHATHDIGEVNKSLMYMGKHNLKLVLRNRRFEGEAFKNSIQILSKESQKDIIDYKNSFVKLLEEVAV